MSNCFICKYLIQISICLFQALKIYIPTSNLAISKSCISFFDFKVFFITTVLLNLFHLKYKFVVKKHLTNAIIYYVRIASNLKQFCSLYEVFCEKSCRFGKNFSESFQSTFRTICCVCNIVFDNKFLIKTSNFISLVI